MKKQFLLLGIFLCSFITSSQNIFGRDDRFGLNEASISKQKMQEATRLTDNAIKHIKNVPIADACYDFIYNPVWRKGGDLFVSVYDEDGICLAHGDDMDLIWKNINNASAFGSTPILAQMLNAGPEGKKLSYISENAYRSSYIRTVTTNGVTYIVEVGFFPKDNQYITKEIVDSVKTFLNEYDQDVVFSLVNDPQGQFAKNDITTMILDMKGNCLANNQNSGLINQNLLDLTDSNGEPIVRLFLKIANEKGFGWTSYIWQNAPTRAYVEKVENPHYEPNNPESKRHYVIVSNYYPNQGLDTVQDFVTSAISFLKNNGPEVAFKEFSDKVGRFVKGGLSIFVYNLKGVCLANWDDPRLVGQNLIRRTDDEGKFITQHIIRVAKRHGRGIVTYYIRHSTAMSYIELVHTPNGAFIVGCEFFPTSKADYIKTLVDKATDYLREHDMAATFDLFSLRSSEFRKGDTFVFVYTQNGRRLVNGSHRDGIWKNFTKATDQEGLPVIQDIITTALNGGGWVKYRIRNGTRRVFASAITKPDKSGTPQTFIVGSGYFI